MKRMMFSTLLLFGIIADASAQSSGSSGSATGSATSTSAPKSAKNKKTLDGLDNRKIYHFNNGQRSTPTGAEATPSSTTGGYAVLGKDTTPSVVAPPNNSSSSKKTSARRKRSQ